MKTFILVFWAAALSLSARSQTITYSEVDKADYKNIDFEILGNFSGNYLVYKNMNKRHEVTVYNSDMTIKDRKDLDFVSDRTENISFVSYPDYFIMVWEYEKGNITYCKGAKIDGLGNLIGTVMDLDTTKTRFFSNKVSYDFTWSENKKQVLLYKILTKNDEYSIVTKLYDENLRLKDSAKQILGYDDRRESFGDLQVSNNGTILFTKTRQNSRPEYLSAMEVNFKKMNNDSLFTVKVPLNDELIEDPLVKIDNLNGKYIINTFSYSHNGRNVNGLFTALIEPDPFRVSQQRINVFDDTLRSNLSGKPDWRTAYNNYSLRNIILKKDGGFIAVAEDYYKQRRFGGTYDPYYPGSSYRYYSSPSDYYLYNRGYYGFYRPFNDPYSRDVIYNYDDVISFSFTKDLTLQWNSVINKTTSDIENDNFLSFSNLNAGGEIHFIFLQKDNNRQILSDHALQPDGSIIRYPTLKSREAGFSFMPRLARQTGIREMIIPCLVRNNIAFAKIEF